MIRKMFRIGLSLFCLVFISSIAVAQDCPLLVVKCQSEDGTIVGEVMVRGCFSQTASRCEPCNPKAPFAYCNGRYSDKCQGKCIACVVLVDPETGNELMIQCYGEEGSKRFFW